MRNWLDRIRHAVCFEIIGVLLVTPLASWVFAAPFDKIGALAIAMSIVATVWNYVYNIGFDHLLLRLAGRTRKRQSERVVHALAFETGMLCLTLPPLMWWMNYGLWQAFAMDVGFMVFYLFYTYLYNWLYDMLFPVPEPGT